MVAPHYKTIFTQQQENLPDSRVLLDYHFMIKVPSALISNPSSDYISRTLNENPTPSIGYRSLSGQKMEEMYKLMQDFFPKKNLYEN